MPNLIEEIRRHSELTSGTSLLPPRFPDSLPTHLDPEGYQDSLERYKRAIEELTVVSRDGVTMYKGGPMNYRSNGHPSAIETAWLTPLLVQDEEGATPIHMITLNGGFQGGIAVGKIEFNTANDADLMLDNVQSEEAAKMARFLDPTDPTPRTLLRASTNGSTYYPYIYPLSGEALTPERLAQRLAKIADVTGIPLDVSNEQVMDIIRQRRKVVGNLGEFDLLEPHVIETPYGKMNLQGIFEPNDAWQYYEILTPNGIENIDRSKPVYMRIDSGCDTGQCYHEKGCDCRNQLHKAMQSAIKEQGVLLLCSSHNGRGYGLITKLATEAAKQGIDIGYNQGLRMKTIEAAETLLGRQFDIRTYEGTVAILKALGISDIRLLTDNRIKYDALTAAGLNVYREETNSLSDVNGEEAEEHLLNKHGYKRIYF